MIMYLVLVFVKKSKIDFVDNLETSSFRFTRLKKFKVESVCYVTCVSQHTATAVFQILDHHHFYII